MPEKKYSICNSLNKDNIAAVEAHMEECNVDSHGSSGVMEAELALVLTEKVYTESDGNVFVHYIVSDNDSTLRCHL